MKVEQVYAIMNVDGHLMGLASTEANAILWLVDQGFRRADSMGFPGKWVRDITYYEIQPESLWR